MEHKLDEFIRHAIEAQPISGTSLIISLYGDALSHRGGEVWLGSLSALLEAWVLVTASCAPRYFACRKRAGWRLKKSAVAASIG
jgi:hypothetical protein